MEQKSYRLETFTAAIAVGMSLVTPTLAQSNPAANAPTHGTAGQPTAPDNSGSATLGEIVVTAEKRSDSAQRVPTSIVAANAATLKALQVTTTNDLDKVAPGIQIFVKDNQAAIFVRGIGQSTYSVNADPYVSVDFNDAYIPAQVTNIAFYDLDHVEALYGPQGTLYGRNALSGVINVFSHRPEFKLSASADIEVANYSTVNSTGVLNVPLSDNFAARIAYNHTGHDGYLSNGAADDNKNGGRVSLLYEPNKTTSFYLVGAISHITGIGEGDFVNKPALTCGFYCFPFDAHKLGLFIDSTIYNASFEISHKFGNGVTVANVAAFAQDREMQNISIQTGALSGSPPVATDPLTALSATNFDNYSDELKLAGDFGRFSAVGGFYAYSTESNAYIAPSYFIQGPISKVGPYHIKAQGLAGYAQLKYHLTEKLRLIGGIRYSDDTRHFHGTNSAVVGGVLTISQTYANSFNKSRPDFKGTIEYDIAPRSMIYLTGATGYNAGGFSSAPVAVGSNVAASFQPTTAKSVELGAKNRFFNNTLQLNAALFYTRYTNYQVSTRSTVTGQTTIYNAPRAISKGVQLDLAWKPTPDDELTAGATFLDAHYLSFALPVAPFTNLNGQDLIYSPHTSINASYAHTFELGGDGSIAARVTNRYVSAEWFQFAHLNGTRNNPYDIVDASVTYRPQGQRWSVGIWSRNLTGTETYVAGNAPAVPGPGVGEVDAPRTYGVRLTGDF